MSSPPDPPLNQPNQLGQPPSPSRNNKRTGALVAIAAVVLIALIVELIALIAQLLGGRGFGSAILQDNVGFGAGLVAIPVVQLACVILGSILTISKRKRQFAVGLLITSAIPLLLTAGACVALIMAFSGL